MSESVGACQPSGPGGFITRSWRAEPHQLSAVRAELHRWLVPFGLTADAAADVVLAVNEAVSNVIDHAYSPSTVDSTVDVTLRAETDSLRIDVADHGTWRPPSTEPSRRGRGIAMMSRLMDAVLVHHDSRGTRVVLHYPRS